MTANRATTKYKRQSYLKKTCYKEPAIRFFPKLIAGPQHFLLERCADERFGFPVVSDDELAADVFSYRVNHRQR